MKKIIILFLLLVNLSFFYSQTNAQTIRIISKAEFKKQNSFITRADAFEYFASFFSDKVPESYKYIKINILGVKKDTKLYFSLQKLVYLDLIENKRVNLFPNKALNKYIFYKYAEKIFNQKLLNNFNVNKIKKKNTTFGDLELLKSLLKSNNYKIGFKNDKNNKIEEKKKIFLDVYKTLQTSFYDKSKLDKIKMFNLATEGLTKGAGDKFTVYFPPVANKGFEQSLKGEYEGIGAYVDMERPGELKIISPISGSPAQKAGIRGGDIVLKVDGKKITVNDGMSEVISWIKGKAGTNVVLTIKRGSSIFNITVTRGRIVIKDVEYKIINSHTFYIKLRIFGPTIAKDFRGALVNLKKYKNVNKIIIDLRNNPGGYLGQVSDILSYFIKAGDPVAVVKYLNSKKIYRSKGYNLINFNKYKIIILQNGGSASASEIMIGGIKDYYPKTILIGEKTYGKGSVQTLKEYTDGSSLKYTVAKWFTGKTETGIDGIGIQPTIKFKADYKKGELDMALEKAINLR